MVQTISLDLDANPVNERIASACPAHDLEPQQRQALALQARASEVRAFFP